MNSNLSMDDKEILKLRNQVDNAYHIIRKLSDKKSCPLLNHIITRKNMNFNNRTLVINNLYYKYVITNRRDMNLAEFQYFEIIAKNGNRLTIKPISLSQIK